MHLKKSDLEKFYRKLLSASWEVFSWKWDHRFEAFLTEFSADNGDEFRAILERDFINVWDSLRIPIDREHRFRSIANSVPIHPEQSFRLIANSIPEHPEQKI
jgi:hypothetical protein